MKCCWDADPDNRPSFRGILSCLASIPAAGGTAEEGRLPLNFLDTDRVTGERTSSRGEGREGREGRGTTSTPPTTPLGTHAVHSTIPRDNAFRIPKSGTAGVTPASDDGDGNGSGGINGDGNSNITDSGGGGSGGGGGDGGGGDCGGGGTSQKRNGSVTLPPLTKVDVVVVKSGVTFAPDVVMESKGEAAAAGSRRTNFENPSTASSNSRLDSSKGPSWDPSSGAQSHTVSHTQVVRKAKSNLAEGAGSPVEYKARRLRSAKERHDMLASRRRTASLTLDDEKETHSAHINSMAAGRGCDDGVPDLFSADMSLDAFNADGPTGGDGKGGGGGGGGGGRESMRYLVDQNDDSVLQDELWYIAMDDLELGPVIGEGTFGKVGEDGICVCLSVCLSVVSDIYDIYDVSAPVSVTGRWMSIFTALHHGTRVV